MGNLKDICFDCADPWMLSHWWADVLGYRVRPYTDEDLEQLRREGIQRFEDDPNVAVDPIDGSGPGFWFCRVPESKVVKNRVHVDVYGDVDELLQRGAMLVSEMPQWTVVADPEGTADKPPPKWVVMRDPEGNEFCVFPPPDSDE